MVGAKGGLGTGPFLSARDLRALSLYPPTFLQLLEVGCILTVRRSFGEGSLGGWPAPLLSEKPVP